MKPLQVIVALIIAAVYLTPQPAEAQFRKLREKVKQTVEQKVEQKVEEKVEQRAERALDKAIGNSVDALADNLESSLESMLFSDAPKPIELGPNESGSPDAPYVQYTLASRIELGGGGSEGGGLAGRLLRRFGSQQETVYTHGDRQRVDTGTESSEIMDAGSGKITHVDHEQKQWWAMSLEEMMASVDEMSKEAMASVENDESTGSKEAAENESKGSVKLTDANITVDRTGKTETINGSKAAQVVMVVEGEYEISAANEETGEEETVRGKSYVVYETWQSKDVAGYNTLAAYQMKAAQAMGAAVSGTSLPDMLGAMQGAAQLPDGTDEAIASLEEEDGLPVRTKLHFVQVAEDATLDLNAVLNGAAPSSGQMSEDELPSQFVLLTVVTEIGNLSTAPFDASQFDPPSTYSEVSSPMQSAMTR